MAWIPERVRHTVFIGCDPAWVHDRFAVAVVEVALWASQEEVEDGWAWRAKVEEPGWVWPSTISAPAVAEGVAHNYLHGRPPDPPFYLRRLVQFSTDVRGNSEKKATEFLRRAITHHAFNKKGWVVCIDKGNAYPYFRTLQKRGFRPYAVTTTGGKSINPDKHDPGVTVPKEILYGMVSSMINKGRLIVPKDFELKDELSGQLKGFEGHQKPSGRMAFGNNAEARHDDLVTAVGLPLFVWENWFQHVERANDELARYGRATKSDPFAKSLRWNPYKRRKGFSLKDYAVP